MKFILLLFVLFASLKITTQDSISKKIIHAVGVGLGAGGSKYLSGISGTFSYEARVNKTSLRLSVFLMENLMIFGGEPATVVDYSLTANKIFPLKRVRISVGTGISITAHKLDSYNFYEYSPEREYPFVTKTTIGLPLHFSAMAKITETFYFGLGGYANYNKLNSFGGGHLKFDFHFNNRN